jgi:hypothetical protein
VSSGCNGYLRHPFVENDGFCERMSQVASTGASLGYQLAAPFAGGLAPIIALLLLDGKTNLAALGLKGVTINIGAGSWQAVSFYMIVLALISFLSVLGLKELTRADNSSTEAYKITEDEVVLSATD